MFLEVKPKGAEAEGRDLGPSSRLRRVCTHRRVCTPSRGRPSPPPSAFPAPGLAGAPPPPAETSKAGCRSEPHLGARGSSKGLAWLLPTAGSNWFGQGAASAGFIPGLRLAARPRPFQGLGSLGSLGKSSVSGAWGPQPRALLEARPCADSALCLKSSLCPWRGPWHRGGGTR